MEEEDQSHLEGPQDIEDELPGAERSEDTLSIASDELLRRSTTLLDTPAPQNRDREAPTPTPSSQKRNEGPVRTEFKISADLWQGSVTDYLERSPFWGPFQLDMRCRIHQDLKSRVPIKAMSMVKQDQTEIPLRHLRSRQQALADRMTVREFYDLSQTSSPELLAYPHASETGREASVDNYESLALPDIPEGDSRSSLLRELKKPRKYLPFAEPPPRFVSTKSKDIAEEIYELKPENDTRYTGPRDSSPYLALEDRWSSARTSNSYIRPPPPTPSASSYGSLWRSTPKENSVSSPQTWRPVAGQPSSPSWDPLKESSSVAPQYGGLFKSEARQEKTRKKRKSLEIDDPAAIEEELRRGSLG